MTHDKIIEWINAYVQSVIGLDICYGTVSAGYVVLQPTVTKIEIQFDNVRTFDASISRQLDSFDNFPRHSDTIYLSGSGVKSLVGINEHVKACKRLYLGLINEGGLGLLLIDDLEDLSFDLESYSSIRCFSALTIIREHLVDKDVFVCQQQLIDAGLEEYARL